MGVLTSCGDRGTRSTPDTGVSLSPGDTGLLCELNLQKSQKGEKYIIHQVSSQTMVHDPVYRNGTFSF